MDLAERTMIEGLEKCNVGHNKVFIKDAIRSALNILLLSILKNEAEVWESVEVAIMQFARSSKEMPQPRQQSCSGESSTKVCNRAGNVWRRQDGGGFAIMTSPSPRPSETRSYLDEKEKNTRKEGLWIILVTDWRHLCRLVKECGRWEVWW